MAWLWGAVIVEGVLIGLLWAYSVHLREVMVNVCGIYDGTNRSHRERLDTLERRLDHVQGRDTADFD